MLVLETVDELLLVGDKRGAQVRSGLSINIDEALQGLLEGLQIEVGRLLVQVVSCISELGLKLADLGALTLNGRLLLLLAGTCSLLLLPVGVMAATVDVVDGQAEDLQRVQQEAQL